MYKKPFVIAEAGCNHMGQMEIAKDLIETAAYFCKADAIKFQKRCPKELLTPEQYNALHPNTAIHMVRIGNFWNSRWISTHS